MVLPVAIIAAFIIVAWRFGYFDLKHPQKLASAADRAQGVPWLGPIFVAIYAVMATLAVPVSPLAYAAGAVFGFGKGSLFVWIASMIGAGLGYLLARTAWAGPARRLLGRYANKLRELRQGNAFLNSFRMQLLPVVPFGVFNYAAAITGLSFIPFLLGSALGIVPGTIAAVFVGDRLVAGLQGDKQPLVIAAAVGAALLALSFAPTLVKKLRHEPSSGDEGN
ncbi:MAG TPA: VTT domain-containing protein [Gemmatimonadaceae bacterium]